MTPRRPVDLIDFIDSESGRIDDMLGGLIVSSRALSYADEAEHGISAEDLRESYRGVTQQLTVLRAQIADVKEAADALYRAHRGAPLLAGVQ